MANASGTGRSGWAAVLTAVAVIGLLAFVAIAIDSYNTEEEVQAIAGGTSETNSAAAEGPSETNAAAAPVGGVATGGGGAAAGSGSGLAVPVVGALGALTLLAVAQMVRRPRRA